MDAQVQSLAADTRRSQFDADCLALARDVAQIANAYREVEKTEHVIRTERIAHLRGQNCIGAAIVAEHMANNMAVHAGPCKDQIALAERAWGFQSSCAGSPLETFNPHEPLINLPVNALRFDIIWGSTHYSNHI